jgi:hypothetical protein
MLAPLGLALVCFDEGFPIEVTMKALIVKTALFSAGCLLILTALATPVFAQDRIAPEIDASSLGSAVTLLAGGYLVLRSKLLRK